MKYSDKKKIGSAYIYIHIYHIYPIHILYTLRWWFHLGSAYLHIIAFIEKYPETIGFDGLVVETSKRRRILCYRIQWVQPKITSYNTCLHLRCPVSVTNAVFSTPHGPLILIKLMSICNLTPHISVCWQQLPDVMLWSLTWIYSLCQIWYAKIF